MNASQNEPMYCVEPNGTPALQVSFVLFLDILGFKEINLRCGNRDRRSNLYLALKEARQSLGDHKSGRFEFRQHQDSIIAAWPVGGGDEHVIGTFIGRTALLIKHFVLHGFFVRGAWKVGEAFLDDLAVLGPAPIQAYLAESTQAKYPRVLVDADYELCRKNTNQYARSHQHLIAKAQDGLEFVNYLELAMKDERKPDVDFIKRHRRRIYEAFDYAEGADVIEKYKWLSTYHNAFCDRYPKHFAHLKVTDIDCSIEFMPKDESKKNPGHLQRPYEIKLDPEFDDASWKRSRVTASTKAVRGRVARSKR